MMFVLLSVVIILNFVITVYVIIHVACVYNCIIFVPYVNILMMFTLIMFEYYKLGGSLPFIAKHVR